MNRQQIPPAMSQNDRIPEGIDPLLLMINEEREDECNISSSSSSSSIISPRYTTSSKRNSNEVEGNSTKSTLKTKLYNTTSPLINPLNSRFSNNNWTKAFWRNRFWCIICLFILVAIMFMVMALWVILKLSKKDERLLVDQITKRHRESMIASKKILSNSEKLEKIRKKQFIVKDHTHALNSYLIETWGKNQLSNNDDSILDLIVFRTVNGGEKINLKKLNDFISETIKKQPEKIRVHLVNHKNRNLNLQTIKNLMESHSNAWLIIYNSKFTLLPSMMYPYHHFFSNEVFYWIDEIDENLQNIPNTWKERFSKSTEFWANFLIERIGKQSLERNEPPLHIADMDNIVRRKGFKFLLDMEELNELEVINQFSRFDILKSLDECNVLSWILPESMEENEKTKLEESITFFLLRFRRVLQKRFHLFITNDKTIYNRAVIFMPQVLLMEEKRSATIAANLYCLSRTPQVSNPVVLKEIALPEMVFSKKINNNIEYIHYFARNHPDTTKLNVAIQVEDFHVHLKGIEKIVKDLAQYLIHHNVQVTIINCGKAPLRLSNVNIPVKQIQSRTQYKELLENEKFTIINAHYSTFGLDIAKELNIPVVQTLHNQYMWLLEEKHKKMLDRFFKADHFTSIYTCVSSDVAMFSDMNLGLDINKMVVISNGISDDQLKDCPSTPLKPHERGIAWMKNILPHAVNPHILPSNITEDYFIISQLDSEISSKMGHHVSILALPQLKKNLYKERKKPLLIISGKFTNKKFQSFMNKLIADNNVEENVLFLNENFSDECSLLKYSDVLLHPSLIEGWSTQLAQAVLYDKDIVATLNAGASDIVSHQYMENGLTTAMTKLVNPPSAYHKIERKKFDLEEFIGQSNLGFAHLISESLYHLLVGRMLHPKKQVHLVIPKGHYQELMTSFVYGGYKKLFELIALTGNNAEHVRHLFGQTYQ